MIDAWIAGYLPDLPGADDPEFAVIEVDAVRVVGRRYVRNREGDMNTGFQVEFVLKGLGSAGQDTDRTLRRAILGYYRDDLYLVPPSNIAPRPDDNSYAPDPMP